MPALGKPYIKSHVIEVFMPDGTIQTSNYPNDYLGNGYGSSSVPFGDGWCLEVSIKKIRGYEGPRDRGLQ